MVGVLWDGFKIMSGGSEGLSDSARSAPKGRGDRRSPDGGEDDELEEETRILTPALGDPPDTPPIYCTEMEDPLSPNAPPLPDCRRKGLRGPPRSIRPAAGEIRHTSSDRRDRTARSFVRHPRVERKRYKPNLSRPKTLEEERSRNSESCDLPTASTRSALFDCASLD